MSNQTQNNLLQETGVVVEISGNYAVIEIQRRSACGHCDVSCGTSVLAGLFSRRRNRVRLYNHPGLRKGDTAVIGISESVLLSTAVMAYMLPLTLMIALAILASMLGYGDGVSFIASMLGLFAGMQISNRIMGDKDFQGREIVLLGNGNETVIKRFDQQAV